jgi:hypothetical protein
MPSREVGSTTSARDANNNNSQIDNNLNTAMSTTTTPRSDYQPREERQRYTGTYAEFIKEKNRSAKAAYLQMRHELIERAVLERKKDIESRTVALRDGRRVILPRRSNDAVINMIAESSKYDRE